MATPDEIRKKIESLPLDEQSRFFGQYGATVDSILIAMSANPNWEAMLCYDLKLPTEAEKVAQATIQQAKDQRWSVRLSWIAIAIAVISLLVSLHK
jgi:transcription initiation factor TFIIIB Brf1 subunit/transcription initiation factor TFIIB